jgi:hypothetical protein
MYKATIAIAALLGYTEAIEMGQKNINEHREVEEQMHLEIDDTMQIKAKT